MRVTYGLTDFTVLLRDTLSWGNLTVQNQTFVLCDTMAEILDVMPIDGIMGSKYSSQGQLSARHILTLSSKWA